MKNLYSILFLILIIGCSKEPEVIERPLTENDSISFEIISTIDTAYINQPVNFSFNIDDSIQNFSEYEILWSIDGKYFVDTSNIRYAFSNSGLFLVKLSMKNQERIKKIRIHPGMISYQILNLSHIDLDLNCYVDNPWNFGTSQFNIKSEHLSDTIFSNCINIGIITASNLLGINLEVNGTEYQYKNAPWIHTFQNSLIELNDSSLFIKTLSTSEGPKEIRLYELNK